MIMALTYSQHAIQRMNERGLTMGFVQATVDAGYYIAQAHGTRLYNGLYSYNVAVPTPVAVPVMNAMGQQVFNTQWQPMFNTVIVMSVNTVSFTVSVVTDGSGTHVVTVWWN
jgi:hypothetical protein